MVVLTDGEIKDTAVEKFAQATSEHGLHDTACFVAVFGKSEASLVDSVGLVTYALAPNSLSTQRMFHESSAWKWSTGSGQIPNMGRPATNPTQRYMSHPNFPNKEIFRG